LLNMWRKLDPDIKPVIVGIAGIGLAVLMSILWGQIGTGYGMELLFLGVLVLVTMWYATHTKRMANAMREQFLGEARPYLLLTLNLEKDVLLQWDDYESERRPTEFPITIHNAGKGPAKNLKAALWHRGKTHFLGDYKGYLAPNKEWQATISRLDTAIQEKEGWLPQLSKMIKENEAGIAGIIAVEYQDVHNRKWASYLRLERHIDIEQFVMEGEQNIVEIKNNDS